MLGGAIGDDRDVRLGDLRQVADFTDVIRPQFQHEIFVIFPGGEDRQRNADVIVEAPGRHRAFQLFA